MARANDSRLLEGVTVAERYVLEEQLGAGGMGSVWRARHSSLRKVVALKFMDRELSKSRDLRARFEREARAAAKIDSPHVVRVIDHGVDGEWPYMVMEMLVGQDLGALLDRQAKISIGETLQLARQIAAGLGAAHGHGVIHRDLKPSNIFLHQSGGEVVVKLLDFGIAKMIEDDDGKMTLTGVVMGSPQFMSPEQARSTRRVDARTDLWSFAVILFQCFTGRELFAGSTPADIFVKVCAEPIPLPSSFDEELPAALDGFFAKALERDVERRFQSAVELLEALDGALDGAPSDEPLLGLIDAGQALAPSGRVTADLHDETVTEPLPETPKWSAKTGTLTSATVTTDASADRRSLARFVLVLALAGAAVSGGLVMMTRGESSPVEFSTDVGARHAAVDAEPAPSLATSAPAAPESATPPPSATNTTATGRDVRAVRPKPKPTAPIRRSIDEPPAPEPPRAATPPPASTSSKPADEPAWGF